jgi:hypothetical protein
VDDIAATPDRWPSFAERALADGFNSVFAIPLRLREVTLGGLNLFGTERSALDEDGQVIAKSLADVATIGILQQRSLNRTSLLAEDLQRALNTRIVLEQAKGILSERGGIALDEAFRLLRSYSRSNNQKLSDVASEVVGPPHLADRVLAKRQA